MIINQWFIKWAVFFPVFYVSAGHVNALTVDLNNFFADPSVAISSDGTSALILEDAFLSSVLLSNDPGLGDPNVIIPANNTTLDFSYEFIEGLNNDDEFRVTLFDADTAIFLNTFFADVSSSGLVSFDLSGFVGQTLGLQFELRSFDNAFDSSVNIFNVSITPIPLPGAWVLFLSGLGLITIFLRNKKILKLG